jgi:hypothetical protein
MGTRTKIASKKAKNLWAGQRKNAQCSGSNPRTLHKIGRTFAYSSLISLTRCRFSQLKSMMRGSCIGASASAGQLQRNFARKMRKQYGRERERGSVEIEVEVIPEEESNHERNTGKKTQLFSSQASCSGAAQSRTSHFPPSAVSTAHPAKYSLDFFSLSGIPALH